MNAPAIPKTLPSAEDIALARESGRVLSTVLKTRAETQQIDFHDDQGAVRTVSIPTSALRLLLDVLTEIGQGNAVSIIPIHAELTTQEAADVLNVSRPFVIKEIEAGRLPHRMVGTHRRVAFEDLMAYARKMRERQEAALERLAENARELGLEY